MSLISTFSPREPQWRGNTSSEDMNLNFSEILYDLNNVFDEATKIVVTLNELESRIRHELSALNNRLYSVSGIITTYETSASGYKMFHEDFYMTKNVAYPNDLSEEDRCVVCPEFGVVTLPIINSFSKVYTLGMSDGKVVVSPDLSLEVVPIDEDGVIKVDETNPLNACDGEDSGIWERKARFNTDYVKSAVRCLLDIKLPSMSNPYVNRLMIKPYPEGIIDVQAITYDTLISSDTVLPGFPVDGENNMPSAMYCFDNIEPTRFKIYLRQRNSVVEDDYKTFVYGAKEISIEKVEFRETGKIGVRFDLPEYETSLLKSITSLRTDPEYDNINYKVYLYPTESDFNVDNPVWTSNNSPITATNPLDVSLYVTESVWVLVEMLRSTNDTSSILLNSVTLTYTTV